jgi:hypothetical protein
MIVILSRCNPQSDSNEDQLDCLYGLALLFAFQLTPLLQGSTESVKPEYRLFHGMLIGGGGQIVRANGETGLWRGYRSRPVVDDLSCGKTDVEDELQWN